MTPMALPPWVSRMVRRRLAMCSKASSQLTATSLPPRRTSGSFRRAGVFGEIEGVAPFDAEKIAVDAALIAIIAAHDLHAQVRAAHPQGGLAAVPAMRAYGAHVVHLPRPRLITISAGGKRADGADSMHMPHSSHSRWSSLLGAITELTFRFWIPSAHTSMPSPQTRTQR